MRRKKKINPTNQKNIKKYRNARTLQNIIGNNVYEVSKGKIK